jgi:effector-binding domain-containing protein
MKVYVDKSKLIEELRMQISHSHHNADESATLYMQHYYDGMKEAYKRVISYIDNMEILKGGDE